MSDDVAREHPRFADWDAAYVLGALTPTDRRLYEEHLDTCPRCRAAVGELSGLPGLLAAVPDAEREPGAPTAGDDDPPVDLLPRLGAAVGRARRRRRWYTAAGGLVAAALVAAGVVLAWPDATPRPAAAPSPGATGTGPTTVAVAMQQVVANPLTVDVLLVPEAWGTRIDMQCRFAGDGGGSGPDRTYAYSLYLTNRKGQTMQAAGWTYGPDTQAEPVGTSQWPVDQIATLEVRTESGQTLLRGTTR